jgi:hypothetical protein
MKLRRRLGDSGGGDQSILIIRLFEKATALKISMRSLSGAGKILHSTQFTP